MPRARRPVQVPLPRTVTDDRRDVECVYCRVCQNIFERELIPFDFTEPVRIEGVLLRPPLAICSLDCEVVLRENPVRYADGVMQLTLNQRTALRYCINTWLSRTAENATFPDQLFEVCAYTYPDYENELWDAVDAGIREWARRTVAADPEQFVQPATQPVRTAGTAAGHLGFQEIMAYIRGDNVRVVCDPTDELVETFSGTYAETRAVIDVLLEMLDEAARVQVDS